jgi:L-lactate utilization protein LutC
MTAREAILRDVRRNLGRDAAKAPAAPPPARIRMPEVPREERIASMLERVAALAGRTLHAHSTSEAVDYVAERTRGAASVASNAPFLRQIGITALPGVESGFTDERNLREACARVEVGITSADYALADTGTLVMIASPAEARLVSLVPPVHIAVVPAERVLTGLDELFALHPLPAEKTSSMVLITGPSRTADIEQILVRGVHGPGEIHVVIVD